MNKTKVVTLYVDLFPNWQHSNPSYLNANEVPYDRTQSPKTNAKRIAFDVELPCIEEDFHADAKVEVAKNIREQI